MMLASEGGKRRSTTKTRIAIGPKNEFSDARRLNETNQIGGTWVMTIVSIRILLFDFQTERTLSERERERGLQKNEQLFILTSDDDKDREK